MFLSTPVPVEYTNWFCKNAFLFSFPFSETWTAFACAPPNFAPGMCGWVCSVRGRQFLTGSALGCAVLDQCQTGPGQRAQRDSAQAFSLVPEPRPEHFPFSGSEIMGCSFKVWCVTSLGRSGVPSPALIFPDLSLSPQGQKKESDKRTNMNQFY